MKRAVVIFSLVFCVFHCDAMKHSKKTYTEQQRINVADLTREANFDAMSNSIGRLQTNIKSDLSFLDVLSAAIHRAIALSRFAEDLEENDEMDENVGDTLYRQARGYITSFISVYEPLRQRLQKLAASAGAHKQQADNALRDADSLLEQ
ncbi:MAG: hypothetical protein LBP41_02100 [Holosporaceae bacterium]|jgi:hypothetical protein|nr:hypothetical protein [Holosporaceae bacterium]